ncbi:MAG: SCO7613 C-terminal domain-containing membrane protein [Aeromicrobium sp.]
MGFADPSVCPSCRGRIDRVTRCPHCGLDLTTHEIQQAWQALVVADQWIDRARTLQPASAEPAATDLPTAPAIPPPPRRRSVSAGSVLLGLGAVFLLVAGSIFISVSWGSLGVLGRALVLLAVTALIGAIGWFVTRRGLRASAEALWTVFFGLLTLDWFAARDQGLAGLDTLPFGAAAAVWGALVIGAGLVVVRTGRRHLARELLAPSIIAGAAAWFAAGSLGVEIDTTETAFWPAVLATAVVAAAGEVLRRGSARVGAWIGVAGVAVFGLFAIGSAVAEAVDHPSLRELVVDVRGLPLLLVVVAAMVGGILVTRSRWAASAIALAGAATLVCLPIQAASPERGGFVAVAGLVALGAWMSAREGDWFRGARLTVALGAIGLALAASPWIARLLAVVAEGASASRAQDLATRLRPEEVPEIGPAWVAAVVAAGLVLALVTARRWPEAAQARAHLLPAAWCTGAAGALGLAATLDPPAVAIGGALVAGGALLALVLTDAAGWRWVGPTVVAIAPLATLSSWPAAVIVWPLAGIALAVVASRARKVELHLASAFVGTAWGLGTTAAVLELIDGDDRWTALGLVVAGLVGLAVSLFTVRDDLTHVSVETASAGLGVIGITIGSVVSTLGFAALTWTVAGAGVVVLGLASPRRAWYRWVGAALLGTAYVLRLAASDVEVVEAYTLPFAVLLLAAGLWAMRDDSAVRRPEPGTPAELDVRRPEPDTHAELDVRRLEPNTPAGSPGSVRALLPGVILALLPSLPEALDEPTGLRALLLGIGAALALAVGTWRRWKVPFIGGAVVLALLVLVNVGPLTLAMPRWVLIASVGAVLLAAGITWEDRVRDGRAVIRHVGSMR